MLFGNRQRFTINLEDSVFAKFLQIEEPGIYRVHPDCYAHVLSNGTAPITGGKEWRPDVGDMVLVCRQDHSPRIVFDSLRSEDRRLLELQMDVRVSVSSADQFHGRVMCGRTTITRDDLDCLLRERLKAPVRTILGRFSSTAIEGNESVRTNVSRGIHASPELSQWARDRGITLEHLHVSDCSSILDPLEIEIELQKAKAEAQIAQQEVHVSLEEALERLRQRWDEVKYNELMRRLRQRADILSGFEKLRDELLQRDKNRCQHCHRAAEANDEMFQCRDCGRNLCRAHEQQHEVCRNCWDEKAQTFAAHQNEDVFKCPLSGHYVKKTSTFTCTKCDVTACDHCYDRETRSCVKCAVKAARQSAERNSTANVAGLLGELTKVPQIRDLRLWSDSRCAVQRGIAVAPRNDIRVFRLGDRVQFRYQAELDGFVRLFVVQSDGTSVPLFPNEYCKDYFVFGGDTQTFPKSSDDFSFPIAEPLGVDAVVAVTAATPFRVFDDDSALAEDCSPAPSNSRVKGLPETIRILEKLLDQIREKNWSCAQCQILVQR